MKNLRVILGGLLALPPLIPGVAALSEFGAPPGSAHLFTAALTVAACGILLVAWIRRRTISALPDVRVAKLVTGAGLLALLLLGAYAISLDRAVADWSWGGVEGRELVPYAFLRNDSESEELARDIACLRLTSNDPEASCVDLEPDHGYAARDVEALLAQRGPYRVVPLIPGGGADTTRAILLIVYVAAVGALAIAFGVGGAWVALEDTRPDPA